MTRPDARDRTDPDRPPVGTPRAPARTEGPVAGGASLEPEDVAPHRGRARVGLIVLAVIIVVTIGLGIGLSRMDTDPEITGPVLVPAQD